MMKTKNIILLILFAIPFKLAAQINLTLDDCLELATENNAGLRNAELDILYAKARKSETFTYYFPTVKANAVAFHFAEPLFTLTANDLLGTSDLANDISRYFNMLAQMYGLNTSYSLLHNGYSANLSLMQPIYVGGKIVNSGRLASLGVAAAELQQSITERNTKEDIESRYWKVISLTEKMKVADSGMELLDSLHKDVISAYNAGLAVEKDMIAVRNEYNSLKTQQSRLRSGIRLAKMDLFNTIGQKYSLLRNAADSSLVCLDDISLVGELEDDILEPMAYYYDPSEIIMNLEESQMLALSVKRHELQKKVILADALPQIAVGASYGYGQVVGNPEWNGVVYATINIPISDWGKTSHRMKQEEILKQKAINDRNYLEAQLILQTRQYWESVVSAWDLLNIAEEDVELKRLVLQQSEADYNAGIITYTPLLKAHTDYLEAQTTFSDSQIQYRMAVNKYMNRRK